MATIIDTHQPLVSIIIPTFNRIRFLQEAVASAVQQTYQNTEIIVADDCSPENPQALIHAFQDPRIKFIRNAQNLGNGPNAVNAFKQSSGKYVASLNDDDAWEPSFLEKLVEPLEANPNLVLAFCDQYIMDENGKIDEAETEINTKRWRRDRLAAGVHQPFHQIALIDRAVSPASSAVVRREALNWDELYGAGVYWDYYIAYLACRTGQGAYYEPSRLARYRVHPQSETTTSGSHNVQAKMRKAKASMFCYEQFMQNEQLQEFKPYFQQQWAKAQASMGIALLRDRQSQEARSYLWEALRQQKFNLRSLAALALSFAPPSLAARF